MRDFEIRVKTGMQEFISAKVTLELLEQPDSKLTIILSDGRVFSAISVDAFSALRKIREKTEPLGIKFLIQGCRPNCWPSGMSAQMSNGTIIYERELNKDQYESSDKVNTFDFAEEEQIGTLKDQDEFNYKFMYG